MYVMVCSKKVRWVIGTWGIKPMEKSWKLVCSDRVTKL